jgi:hypothetical protein
MDFDFSELMATASERMVTIRTADGHPLFKAKLLYAAAVAAAGVIIAPRVTAVAGIGALFKGITLTVDAAEGGTDAAPAA